MSQYEVILAELKEIRKDMGVVKKVVSGNGDPGKGLIVQMVQLKATVSNHIKQHTREVGTWRWVFIALIAVAGLVVSLWKSGT